MSKFAGLAGLRVGYGIFSEALLPYLQRVTPSFANISIFSADIAIAALDDVDELLAFRDKIVEEYKQVLALIEQLKELGKLHEQGVLTDEEFAAQKAKVLG